ncbi:c-type cytochrome [Bradyrhizobium genosp. P]|uniref:c-type cytochrome n=1 Tax=Bradyrhizobium genosp. P TaxID=83641 RepID=UPI003CEA554B
MSALGFRYVSATVCVAFGFAILQAVAGPAEVAQIKPRQSKLRDMGGALKAINDEIKKGKIDWDNTIIPNAETIKDRSAYLLNWFPKGSGPEAGVKTYALPDIWQNEDDFAKLGKAAQAEATKLHEIALKKDENGLKAQALATGKACKACHDSYRSRDYENQNEDE